jgi:hypothetical protein
MAFSLERLGLGMDIRRLKVCLSVLFLKSFERRPCCRGVDLNGDGLGQLTLGVCRWFVSTSEQSLNSYAAKTSDVPTKMICFIKKNGRILQDRPFCMELKLPSHSSTTKMA